MSSSVARFGTKLTVPATDAMALLELSGSTSAANVAAAEFVESDAPQPCSIGVALRVSCVSITQIERVSERRLHLVCERTLERPGDETSCRQRDRR